MMNRSLPIIGWQERVSFPELAISEIKAKISTGHDISIIYPHYISQFEVQGQPWVRFSITNAKTLLTCETEVITCQVSRFEKHQHTHCPIINTHFVLGNKAIAVDFVLIEAKVRNFRVLLGKNAIQGNFIVDSEAIFLMDPPSHIWYPPF